MLEKLYFFAAYEGFRATRAANTLDIIPTQAQLGGDFSGGNLNPIYQPLYDQAGSQQPGPTATGSFSKQHYSRGVGKPTPGGLSQGDLSRGESASLQWVQLHRPNAKYSGQRYGLHESGRAVHRSDHLVFPVSLSFIRLRQAPPESPVFSVPPIPAVITSADRAPGHRSPEPRF